MLKQRSESTDWDSTQLEKKKQQVNSWWQNIGWWKKVESIYSNMGGGGLFTFLMFLGGTFVHGNTIWLVRFSYNFEQNLLQGWKIINRTDTSTSDLQRSSKINIFSSRILLFDKNQNEKAEIDPGIMEQFPTEGSADNKYEILETKDAGNQHYSSIWF